jgi:hypothetical protein
VSITTYDELKSSIADTLNRDDLTTVIPSFISLAEAALNRDLRHWRNENRAIAPVNSRYTALPSDFVEPIRMELSGDKTKVSLMSHYEMQTLRQSTSDRSGKPRNYNITQGEVELYPTPDSTYNLEMYYYGKIPNLSGAAPANQVLTNFPDVYLYGSLLHSAPYLGDDQRTMVWAALYKEAVSAINTQSEKAKQGAVGRKLTIRSY